MCKPFLFFEGTSKNLAQCVVCHNTVVKRKDKLLEKDLPSQCQDCYRDIAKWDAKVHWRATVVPRIP